VLRQTEEGVPVLEEAIQRTATYVAPRQFDDCRGSGPGSALEPQVISELLRDAQVQ
jgi:hypothetical protein